MVSLKYVDKHYLGTSQQDILKVPEKISFAVAVLSEEIQFFSLLLQYLHDMININHVVITCNIQNSHDNFKKNNKPVTAFMLKACHNAPKFNRGEQKKQAPHGKILAPIT